MGLAKATQVCLYMQSTFARVVYTLFANSKGIQTYQKLSGYAWTLGYSNSISWHRIWGNLANLCIAFSSDLLCSRINFTQAWIMPLIFLKIIWLPIVFWGFWTFALFRLPALPQTGVETADGAALICYIWTILFRYSETTLKCRWHASSGLWHVRRSAPSLWAVPLPCLFFFRCFFCFCSAHFLACAVFLHFVRFSDSLIGFEWLLFCCLHCSVEPLVLRNEPLRW